MKKVIKIDKSIIFITVKIISVFIFLIFTLQLFACSVKVTVITIDSLTGRNINNHVVDIDEKESYYAKEGTNISEFILDFEKKQSYNIRIRSSPAYYASEFKLAVTSECADTSIVVKLLYRFPPRQLPVFFFNKNDIFPDTNNLKKEIEAASYLSKRHKKDNLIIQLDAYFYPENNQINNTLVMNRINYIKSLLVDLGADSNMIEIGIIEYKPYIILQKEEINEYFKFKDVVDQKYINNLPIDIRPIAEKYNRRIVVRVRDRVR